MTSPWTVPAQIMNSIPFFFYKYADTLLKQSQYLKQMNSVFNTFQHFSVFNTWPENVSQKKKSPFVKELYFRLN